MEKQRLTKRLLSVVMAFVMAIGMTSTTAFTNVQAAEPVEYQIEVTKFWGASSNTQLVSAYTGTVAAGTVFTGTVILNGKETSVNWVTSGQNFFIKMADTNTQILVADTTSIKVTAGTKMVASNGDYITITNDCAYVKDTSGNLVAAPKEYQIEVTKFWGASNNTQLVSAYTGTVAAGTVFTGTVILNGKETSVNWVTSGQNFFIKTADTNTQILVADTSSIKVTAGTKMVASNGDYITIANDCSYVKDASGNLVPAPEESKQYQIEVTKFWGAASNTNLVSAYTGTVDAADGTAFTGTIKYNGKDQEVRWDKSGANFFVKTTAGVQILVADTTSIEVTAGTKMVAENGDYITITNDCSYVKDASGNLVPAPEESKEYQIEVTKFWGAASNTNLVSAYTGTIDAADGTAFVGTINYNGKDQEVRWDKSGANFFVKTTAGVQILVADTTSIEITAGTKMVAENGDYITITNNLKASKIAGEITNVTGLEEVTLNCVYNTEDIANNRFYYSITNPDDFIDDKTYGATSMRGWCTAIVKIDGVDTKVNLFLGDGFCYFGNQDDDSDAIVAAVKARKPITIPETLTVMTQLKNYVITLNFTEEQNLKIEDLGKGWGIYTSDYQYPNGNVLYYNIDNGSVYTLTSSNNAIAVDGHSELTAGSTISTVGTYDVTRIENGLRYQERIVLYKHGDADENNEIDIRDLVAMRWAKEGTNEEQNARLAGMYAADIDRSGAVDDVDLTALRKAFVSSFDIIITNSLVQEYGGSAWNAGTAADTAEGTTKLSTALTFYKVMDNGQVAFTYANNDIKALADGAAFTGSILLDDMEYEITWKKSGNCLMTPDIRTYGDGNITKIAVKAGTKLVFNGDSAATALAVSKGNSVLNGVMPIAGFSTPTDAQYVTEEMYETIAGTGINMIAYCGNAYYNELTEKHLQLAEKNNLKMYVTDSLLLSQTAGTMPARVGKYSMYHSFLGLHIVDELSYGVYQNTQYTDRTIENYKDAIALYNSSANINGYVNQFPYYSDIEGATTANYKEYLTKTFTNTGAEILSYDHYAIRAGENSWFQAWVTGESFKKTVKAQDFYKNLEIVRAQVEGTGKPFWAFAQAGYPIAASGTVSDSVRVTAAEQQWEINAALAMGAKGIQYYQLFQSSSYAGSDGDYGRSGLIGANGQVNTTYYNAAKELNAFIAVIDEVLMNAENKGVIVNDSTASGALSSDVKLSSYKELTGVTGSNAMVGCFDYYGKTALLVVNCNTSSAQNITLNFAESCKAAVTKMGDTAVNRTAASAASVTINVGAGQSALVIIE